jgi:hypothetical protein
MDRTEHFGMDLADHFGRKIGDQLGLGRDGHNQHNIHTPKTQ